ncbi:hypothetical protein BGZ81_007433 [Podila clonocystis]|nr:hypothetical protein BGZ81_007433 [Podila clonocystis]
MSIIEVKVPQLSESVAEATLLKWLKHPGEAVERDETIIEIETDKVVLEVPAPAAGVIAQVLRNDGDTVVTEEVIATIDTEAKESLSPTQVQPVAATDDKAASASSSKSASAMPSAAKLLNEKDISKDSLQGSGRDGRITKADALAIVQGQAPNASASSSVAKTPSAPAKSASPLPTTPSLASLGGRFEQRVPMSRLRARIAERLIESQQTNAILTTFNEVNMQAVIDLRAKYKDKFEKQHGVRLGFMSFFVKAAVHALKKYPIINASVDGHDIVYHDYFDIGIAVGSPRGLVVPILRDVDQMNLADIEKKVAEYGQKAKDGKLTLEELTGGTFSISNGGVFGSMLSTPIINPPQSAILGVHATKERAVVENGQVVVRPMNYLAMSYDHRIIDGREAVLGLVAMKEALEDPASLLFDL